MLRSCFLIPLAMATLNCAACSLPPPPIAGAPWPRVASAGDLYVEGALVLDGVPEEISPQMTSRNILRVRVTRWLHGNGPDQLEVTGFRMYVSSGAACPPSGADVVVGKRNLMVLNSPLVGATGKAFDKREVPAGRVDQVAWALE
jgi:hypothetical protein